MHSLPRVFLWSLLGFLIVALVGLVVFLRVHFKRATMTQPSPAQTHLPTSLARLNSGQLGKCIDQPVFSVLPMAETDFFAFRPLGFVAPPIHVLPAKHSSFSVTPPGETGYRRFPVVFPGDVTVTSINTTEWIGQNKTGYQLYFSPCDGFKAYFYHLGDLAPNLKNGLTTIENPSCRQYPAGKGIDVKLCQYQTSLTVKAGDLAGYSGDAAGVDFGAVDYNAPPLAFANPDDYTQELRSYVSPINYFTPEAKAQLLARVGSYDGTVQRTKEPVIGEIAQDIAGTAQGNWFPPGVNWAQIPFPDPAPFLALVHDYVGEEPVFSIGTAVEGVTAGLYSFTPQMTGLVNRDFGDVKPGTIHCYDNFKNGQTTGKMGLGKIEGILILELADHAHLKIEKIGTSGSTCAAVPWTFTTKATTYER